jgi:hypothetical protein
MNCITYITDMVDIAVFNGRPDFAPLTKALDSSLNIDSHPIGQSSFPLNTPLSHLGSVEFWCTSRSGSLVVLSL